MKKVVFHKLSNGLTLAVARNPAINSVVVMAGVKVGSRHEPDGLYGAAHFAEHIFFKGTKKRPSSKKLSMAIDAKGGEHNAWTDKEMTAYYVQMSKHDASVALDVVHDMYENALFRPADIEKERPVIREEISMYDNDPNSNVWELSEKVAFEGTGLAHRITGTIKDVSFTPGALKMFLRRYYVPSRTIVALTGAVDDKLVDQAKAKFGAVEATKFLGQEDYRLPGIKPGHDFQVGNTERLHMVVRFPGVPDGAPNAHACHLAASVLGGYSSARLFQSLREDKGLCYGVHSALHGYSDTGSISVFSELDRPKFAPAMKAILAEVNTIRRHGVTAAELESAKSNTRGVGLMELDRPMSVAVGIVRQIFRDGKYESPESRIDRLMKVRRDDVNDAAKVFLDSTKKHVAVVGPKAARKEVLSVLGYEG